MSTTSPRATPATRRARGRNRGAATDPREVLGRPDHLVAAFEDGPFASLELADFPRVLVELFERQTGMHFDPRAFAAFERARLFLGWSGAGAVHLPALLAQHQVPLADNPDTRPERLRAGDVPAPGPTPRATRQAAPSRARDAIPPRGGPIDPRDLGDD